MGPAGVEGISGEGREVSRADGVLVVVLKRKPFEDIRDGIKLEEYRGINWADKIIKKYLWDRGTMLAEPWNAYPPAHFELYHTLRAFLGYAKDRQMIERKISYIDWGEPNPEWTYGIVSPGECFRIHLEPMK